MLRRKNKYNGDVTYDPEAFRFGPYAWKQFKRSKPALIAFYMLTTLVFIAIFAPLISNDQPLYVKYRGQTYYPAFNQLWISKTLFGTTGVDSTLNPETGKYERLQYDITDWRKLETESILWPLVPYSPEKADYLNREYVGPGDEQYVMTHDARLVHAPNKFRHHLGTDEIGRDVLAGLIHGTRTSLLVGLFSMGIAALIGIILGAIAGFFGDFHLRTSLLAFILGTLGIIPAYFYAFVKRSYIITEAFDYGYWTGIIQFLFSIFIFIFLPVLLGWIGNKIAFGTLKKRVRVPIDSVISRTVETMNALPKLLLIISISAVIETRSIVLVILIIGLTSWTEIARFTRAEILRVRELDYIKAAQSLGYSNWRIILKHAIPNAMAPIFVTIAFGIAGAILIESGLSFLNIGVPTESVTWGSLLNLGRKEFEAWWLVIFPGLAIFITITIYNLIGEGLRDALDPRLKR